jgi:hypothetical protein
VQTTSVDNANKMLDHMATNIQQEKTIDNCSKKVEQIIKQIDQLKDDVENAGNAIELKKLEHELNTEKHALDASKNSQDLKHSDTSHTQSTLHKNVEFLLFLFLKLFIIIVVIRFVYDVSMLSFEHINALAVGKITVDHKVSMTIIIGGLSSSVILLALLMKGVFGTKTDTTSDDIPISAVIKAIMAAFKSTGKS